MKWGTILVASIVIALLALAVSALLNRKGNGIGGCGGCCSSCNGGCARAGLEAKKNSDE